MDVSWTCIGLPMIRTVLPAVRAGRDGRAPMNFSLRGPLMRGVGFSMLSDVIDHESSGDASQKGGAGF
jgi:hypothetical protein